MTSAILSPPVDAILFLFALDAEEGVSGRSGALQIVDPRATGEASADGSGLSADGRVGLRKLLFSCFT